MHERMLDKTRQPTDEEMLAHIGQPIGEAWTSLRLFLVETYAIQPIFNSGGQKYGWNLQHRLGGRPLCELYPERGSFTALVILGKVELDQALARLASFGPTVQQSLENSPRYHDGCWMYIRVSDPLTCSRDGQDIQQLILIKRKPPRRKAASIN
jgi:hypothetical protein